MFIFKFINLKWLCSKELNNNIYSYLKKFLTAPYFNVRFLYHLNIYDSSKVSTLYLKVKWSYLLECHIVSVHGGIILQENAYFNKETIPNKKTQILPVFEFSPLFLRKVHANVRLEFVLFRTGMYPARDFGANILQFVLAF